MTDPEQGSRWTLFLDGASNALGNGIDVVLVSPKGCHTPFTDRLCFNCTNNMAEYEACIFGLKAAIDLGIKSLVVFGVIPQNLPSHIPQEIAKPSYKIS